VDDARLARADEAYASGDWSTAAAEYLGTVAADAHDAGYAYHRAGNALLKLKRLEDAADAYERALEDGGYADRATVACNLGTVRSALKEYDSAAEAFRSALETPGYGSRYRALQGLAGACLEAERLEDAVEAYREAVLDPVNPEPGTALNNLGLCYMKLGRPGDAVEAYRAATDLAGYAGRGRAAANLGMAYAALGMHERAVKSFDRARGEFGHEFSPALAAAYRASLLNVAEGDPADDLPPDVTGPMRSQVMMLADEPEDDDTQFFTITEAEIREAARSARKEERTKQRTARPLWVSIVTAIAVVVIVVGGFVAAYLYGLGYPTQQVTVEGLVDAHVAGEEVTGYWVAVPATDVDKAMAVLPAKVKSFDIAGVRRSARTSSVRVDVTLAEGGVVTYDVALAREGVGWKVNGIANSFSSLDDG